MKSINMLNLPLDFLGKAKKILKSDNPFDILEKSQARTTHQQKHKLVEWEPQELGVC